MSSPSRVRKANDSLSSSRQTRYDESRQIRPARCIGKPLRIADPPEMGSGVRLTEKFSAPHNTFYSCARELFTLLGGSSKVYFVDAGGRKRPELRTSPAAWKSLLLAGVAAFPTAFAAVARTNL